MLSDRLAQWRRKVATLFPERHIYVRSRHGVRGIVLSTGQQVTGLAALAGLTIWALVATIAVTVTTLTAQDGRDSVLRERALLDRQAVRGEARLVAAAESLARTRADRLRLGFRLAGVDPASLPRATTAAAAEGGPLIDARDPRALAAALDVDDDLARRIQGAARDVSEARALSSAASHLPLSAPTTTAAQSSSFGLREDPFTGHTAFHTGLDFPAPAMTPVFATARGVVTFTGRKSGYGDMVEIDHGNGFTTRFAHLAVIRVKTGQTVDDHTPIGAIGSTGRSTGPHLHYEIWRDGRPQNPERFLKAGENVQQAG